MGLNNVILLSLIVTICFAGAFFLSLAMIYQSVEKKALRVLNTFIFETTPGFKEKNSYVNYLLFFALLMFVFPFIYYAANNLNGYSVTTMILVVISAFSLAALPFIPLNKLREHFYLDLGALVTTLAVFGIEAFHCYHIYSTYLNNYALIGMIIAIVLGSFLLVPVFNPKLFDLKNNQNEDGTYSRKKFIFLAFTEWLLYPIALLSLLPIYLITLA